ncbi:MAG: right-handed parallel beta-helix repeat-containing protein [Planctomycetes bacterium]|nr:right-handed parallel beta-helix repeat-containing protein [Planctomycetota bacterium]
MTPAPMGPQDLFVSLQGKDTWSGRLSEPNAEKTDGPLATPAGARNRIRAFKAVPDYRNFSWEFQGLSGPITIWLRGGRYALKEPLSFGPEDSAPVTYAAYPGEKPVLDGGERITGWRVTQHNGRTCWVADLPDVADGRWSFRQLFVDGERRPRPRLPREGVFYMEDVPGLKLPAAWGSSKQRAFVAAPGDFGAWRNISDVEVVALHWWIEERFPVVSYDAHTRRVELGRRGYAPLSDDTGKRYARYYVENMFEALDQPGQWYLDRPAGKLYYLPFAGESPETTEVYAPRLLQILRIEGDAEHNRFVEFLRFQGLVFQHTDWRHPDEEGAVASTGFGHPGEVHLRQGDAAAAQAACDVPGVVRLTGARHINIEDCAVRNAGWYGIEVGPGCQGVRIIGNELYDLGGGGIKLNGSNAEGPRWGRNGLHRLTDNHIHCGGRIFHSAVGVLVGHSFGNVIIHNHIHDLYYSGISVGWVWGFSENVTCDNRVEKNHIHHLGGGGLSDMGGIYTLGVQPGTVLRGNLIHDVTKSNYGGWCIYPDEGSSHILIEKNICYETNSQVFHQHYGRENVVRNNIFAFGEERVIALSRSDVHLSFTFERNIVVSRGKPMFAGGYGHRFEQRGYITDLNLFWDITGEVVLGQARGPDSKPLNLAEWQKMGFDRHSLVADPKFRDLEARDFTLLPDSPAWSIGFEPIDLSDVGPRPRKSVHP